MNIKKTNEPFWVKVDTDYDVFGVAADFTIGYFSDDVSTITEIPSGAFDEVMRSTNNKSATVLSDVLSDDSVIPVQAGSTLMVGDVFSDINGNLYYVEIFEDDKITIRGKIKEDIGASTLLTEAGNTGLYKSQVTLDTAGNYTIVIRNTKNGMQNVSLTVNVLDNDLEDMNGKLDQLITVTGKNRKAFI